MPLSVSEDVRRAFAAALRDRLMHHDPVTVPGLGRFVLRHEPSRVVEDDGRRALLPPADTVDFEPERASSHA